MSKLQKKYEDQIRTEMAQELGLTNVLAVPKVTKIAVNIGIGEAVANKKVVQIATEQLAAITGQKPVMTRARISIATFKLVAGDPIGVKVTLRGKRMYDFLEKFISVVLPRVRDFRGVDEKHFDGRGNYSLGFREQIVFPEIEYSKIDKVRGLEVTIVTSAGNDAKAKILLEKLGVPFKKI